MVVKLVVLLWLVALLWLVVLLLVARLVLLLLLLLLLLLVRAAQLCYLYCQTRCLYSIVRQAVVAGRPFRRVGGHAARLLPPYVGEGATLGAPSSIRCSTARTQV